MHSGFLQLFPKSRHIYCKRIIIDEFVTFPESGHDRIYGHKFSCALKKHLADLELILGKFNLLPGYCK